LEIAIDNTPLVSLMLITTRLLKVDTAAKNQKISALRQRRGNSLKKDDSLGGVIKRYFSGAATVYGNVWG